MNKPDFAAFAATARRAPTSTTAIESSAAMRHLQVRLLRDDAIRLRRVAEDRGQSLQAALVAAINLYLRESAAPPVIDPGTGSGTA